MFASVGVEMLFCRRAGITKHVCTTSASILAIDGLNWESWALHNVSPLEQLFLDMFVCLCYSSFWEHKHVPCPLLISVFLYPSVVFLSWHYSMTKNQVNSMSIEDMDDEGGRNCHETADMRALWSPINFIPEDQVRFYQSILTMITSLHGGSEALCLILWIFGNRIRQKAKGSGLRTLKSWTEEDLGSRLEINWQWGTQNLCQHFHSIKICHHIIYRTW